MKLNHVALVSSSEQRAHDFYEGVLGLSRTKSFVVSSELCRQIFDIDEECRVIVYGNSQFSVEVFLGTPGAGMRTRFEHICVAVTNLEEFLKKCETMNVEVNRVPKGDRLLTFVRDYDGNMFEIKALE